MEEKAQAQPQPYRPRTTEERLLLLEFRDEEKDRQLQRGAKAFAEIQHQLRPTMTKVVTWVMGAVFTVGSIVVPVLWKLSKSPDREDYESMAAAQTELRELYAEQRSELRELRTALQQLEKRVERLGSE